MGQGPPKGWRISVREASGFWCWKLYTHEPQYLAFGNKVIWLIFPEIHHDWGIDEVKIFIFFLETP